VAQAAVLAVCDVLKGRSKSFVEKGVNIGRSGRAAASLWEIADPRKRGLCQPAEDVESGVIHAARNVCTGYPNPRHDESETKITPALSKIPLSRRVKMNGLFHGMTIDARTGRRRPHRKHRELLAKIVRKWSLIQRRFGG
jgi:hypothetical protein